MTKNGMTIDMNRKEIRLGEKSGVVKWREGVKGHVRERRKEGGWWESRWIRDNGKWGRYLIVQLV